MELNANRADEALIALAELLAVGGAKVDLVVIGGAGLLALGLIDRSTRDVDVVALRRGAELIDPDPLPPELVEARDRVADDFDLPREWLNTAPRSLLDLGLPHGFVDRLEGGASDLR